jgi:MGT family glycosyltransferase
MASIVYFSFPGPGHVIPTLSVIRELVRRGHRVVYYSTERFRELIVHTGAHFRPYATEFPMPEQGPGPFAHISTTLETLLNQSCTVLDHHLTEVRMSHPTHIMHDSFAPWGRFFAQLLRLPSIASVPTILVNRDIDSRHGADTPIHPGNPRLIPQWYAGFRSLCRERLLRYGLPEIPAPPRLLQSYGDLNVVYTSRFFQPLAEAFDSDRFKFTGPCFQFRPETPPFPFERLDGRPLILVSLGTVYGNHSHFFQMCVEDLAHTPWQVVYSAGGNFPVANLGPIPDNFIVRSFVPQVELLRRCAAFVSHGGMNGVQEALYFGVPLVIAPQAADHFLISSRAAELGAALLLDPTRMKVGAIRAGIASVLSGADYAAAASDISRSLRAAGGPVRAADEIESFIRHKAGADGNAAALLAQNCGV